MSEFAHNVMHFSLCWLLFGVGMLLAGGGFFLATYAACAISTLTERRHQRRLELMDRTIELERARHPL